MELMCQFMMKNERERIPYYSPLLLEDLMQESDEYVMQHLVIPKQ